MCYSHGQWVCVFCKELLNFRSNVGMSFWTWSHYSYYYFQWPIWYHTRHLRMYQKSHSCFLICSIIFMDILVASELVSSKRRVKAWAAEIDVLTLLGLSFHCFMYSCRNQNWNGKCVDPNIYWSDTSWFFAMCFACQLKEISHWIHIITLLWHKVMFGLVKCGEIL